MNDTTEYPTAKELQEHLFVSPMVDWEHQGYFRLTQERIEAIEYIVIEQIISGMDVKWFVELVIDGVHYWDLPGWDKINQLKDWKPIIDRFPICTRIEFNPFNGIWATCKGWQS